GIGVAPFRKRAALILDPVPRDDTAIPQMHCCHTHILERGARPLLPCIWIDAVVFFWDDAALFQLVEQESTVGRNVAFAVVLAQQSEAGALQAASLALRI